MKTTTNPIKLDRLGLGKSQGFRSNHYTGECHIKIYLLQDLLFPV